MTAFFSKSAQNPLLVPNLGQGYSNGLATPVLSAAEVLALNPRVVATSTVTLTGSPANGDVLSLTLSNPVLPGGALVVSFTASSDTAITSASKLAAALTSSLVAMQYNIYGTALGDVLTVNELGPIGNLTQVSFHSTGSTTAVLSNQASSTAVVGGSATESDTVTLVFTNASFAGGHEDVSYTVLATPTLAIVAAGLNAAINADVVLQANNISSSVTAETLTISQKGPNFATLSYTQGENSETVVFASVAGQLQGGSGPVIPLLNFNFSEGSQQLRFLTGQPVVLSSQQVADLSVSGMPIA